MYNFFWKKPDTFIARRIGGQRDDPVIAALRRFLGCRTHWRSLAMTAATILALLALAGCNFQPALSQEIASGELKSINIANIDSVEGAELTHYLSRLIPTTHHDPKYTLYISFEHTATPLAIQKDSSIVRGNVSLKIKYSLKEKATDRTLTAGEFDNINSYDSTFSPYISYDERDQALSDLLKSSAKEVRDRLLFYFSGNTL